MTHHDIDRVVDLLRVLGHEVRLRLMLSLRDREETSVGELENLTGVVQPGLSQQLGILRNAGLVATRREAKQVYYRLVPEATAIPAQMLTMLATPEEAVGEDMRAIVRLQSSRPRGASAALFARIE